MASSKSTIDIVIGTVCKFTGIDAAKRGLQNLAKSVGQNLTNIKSGFEMARAAVSKFMAALSKGMEFERMTVQFKSLTGSLDLAKAHMKDLQDLGRTPPFSLEEFAAASQAMLKMTGGMAGFKKEMEIVGDMAAATGNDIATVGRAFGLAYQVIRDGQDFGRAGQQLYTLGIMTKKQVAEFAELSKAGTDNRAVWDQLCEVFGRYKGAMEETAKTSKGLVEAIQGEATVAMTDLSSAISEAAKPALEGLLGWMKRINEDGTIEDWADSCVSAFSMVAEGAKATLGPVATGLGYIWKTIKGGFESTAQGIGNAVGTIAGGGGVWDAIKAGGRGWKQGWVDAFDLDGAEAEHDEANREAHRNRKAKRRAETAAKAEAEAAKRIEEDMARAQEETDRKAAEAKAKADAESAKKAEVERIKAVESEKKAREKAEADLHKQRVDNLNVELKQAQTKESAKHGVLAAAQTEFDRAFGMYRSEDHGAAAIAEERDYAKDYKQLQKDANRYGGKWRIDELAGLMAAGDTKGQAAKLEEWRKSSRFTPEVESMVRAAAADQTRTTAEDELRKISKNTENLGRKLEELLAMK